MGSKSANGKKDRSAPKDPRNMCAQSSPLHASDPETKRRTGSHKGKYMCFADTGVIHSSEDTHRSGREYTDSEAIYGSSYKE